MKAGYVWIVAFRHVFQSTSILLETYTLLNTTTNPKTTWKKNAITQCSQEVGEALKIEDIFLVTDIILF